MASLVEQVHAELAEAPLEVQREVLDFVRFLRQRRQSPRVEAVSPAVAVEWTTEPQLGDELGHQLGLASSSWSKDWADPDEDSAWASL
jgi:hypothetical protein